MADRAGGGRCLNGAAHHPARQQRRRRGALLEALEERRLLAADLVISEFLASNDTGIQDSFFNREDWIEIHNAGDAPANLNDYFLTDNAGNPEKWRFPSQMLSAGESLIVWASNRDLAVAGQELHTNFALAAGGEYLGLIRASDGFVQFEYAPTYPGQSADISYGLTNSNDPDSARIYFSVPTPGALNAPSVATPTLTAGQTFFGSMQVTISTTTPGATIYYTTNNTAPTTASAVYTGPINLIGSTIVRAMAAAPGEVNSPIASASYTAVDSSVNTFRSNLPIVVLESFGTTFNDQTFVNASATFIDTQADGYADMLDPLDFSGRIGLRYRGSTSFSNYPKKPFAVEVRDENDNDRNASILGMPAESDWILYSPWTERSLMNNALAMDWAREMGHYASRVRFVEVYLNNNAGTAINYTDDYLGVYMLMEKIKRDDNRVDIAKLTPNMNAEPEITGGYIFKKDRKEAHEIAITTTGGAEVQWQPFVMVEPDETELTGAQLSYLTNYLNELDSAMNSPSFADPVNGYAKYIDVDSWVDFWIMAEFTKSVDAFWLSTFFYKPQGGKIHMGPVWDFNLAFGQANYRNGASASGYNHESLGISASFGDQYGYFKRLFQDPAFKLKVTDRWQQLRKTVFNTSKVMADMDAYVALLTDNNGNYPVGTNPSQSPPNPAARNFKKWPVLGVYSTTNSYFDPQGRWIEDINLMKSWIKARLGWMDTQFIPPPLFAPAGGDYSSSTNVAITPQAAATFSDTTILGPGAPARALVPSSTSTAWRNISFNDSSWLSGTTGVGYDTTTSPVNYNPLIGLNVQSAMQNVRTSIYIRVNFTIADPSAIDHLILRMKYDDGFFAWVNGVRVIEAGAPENVNPVFSTAASAERTDSLALQYVDFDISSVKPLLVAGTNVLAIQGLNRTMGGNDLLIMPEIVSRTYANAAAGNVYYTLDDSDPRDANGNPSPSAILYAGPIAVTSSTRIRARTLSGGLWSGIADEIYNFNANNLRITELMYNPPAPPAGSPYTAQDFEFIEVRNIGAAPLNLNGFSFTSGITFTFPNVTLAAGAYAVIVKSLGAFESRYGTSAHVLGFYGGNLDNGGETLAFQNGFAQVVQSFTYNDAWHPSTDGGGYSLVINDPLGPLTAWGVSAGWRASYQPLGLPGFDDADVTPPALQSASFSPAGGTIVLGFNEPIFPAAMGGLSIVNVVTGNPLTPDGHNTSGDALTIHLPPLANGVYALTLPASALVDVANNPLAAAVNFAFVHIAAGQLLALPTGGATFTINQLAIGSGATLDLRDNELVYRGGDIGAWNGSAYTGITGLIASGRNGGAWNGAGIITSMSDAQAPGAMMTLGIAQTGGDVRIAYLRPGDANLDGNLDGDDYFAIDSGFASQTLGYATGDFDYNGGIDADDYWLIDLNYARSAPPAAIVAGGVEWHSELPLPEYRRAEELAEILE